MFVHYYSRKFAKIRGHNTKSAAGALCAGETPIPKIMKKIGSGGRKHGDLSPGKGLSPFENEKSKDKQRSG